MALAPGSRLGPYEILGQIGAGGMGEVYRARDPRLSREVAIKVLPASFSADADRLRRFEQEARAAGLLNHPNITAVYDVGSHEGAPYVVQELLEGETLRSVLAGGKLSPRRAVEYALQIAHGLGAAHEKGIVHRDLKPENLFVTKDGRVKILDFGLAKLTHQEEGAPASNLPTATAGTEPGVVLGTLGYMSPEQVRGKPADPRSDIFSFGAILYEMLSANRAFTGDTAADTMSAILKEDPADLSITNQSISPGLERVVRHCLEKNPEQRFHSAHDVAFALETLTGVSAPSSVGAVQKAGRRRVSWVPVGALLAGAALSYGVLAARRGTNAPPSFRQITFRRGDIGSARFAPDGQTVVYSASWEAKPAELYQSRVGLPEAKSLGLSDGEWVVGVSATGELAVLLRGTAGWTLARTSITGGAPRPIADDVLAADMSRDGRSVVIVRWTGGSSCLEYPIGKVLYRTGGYVSHPRISPDGERVAFLDHPLIGDDRGAVVVVDRVGTKTTLTPQWASAKGLAWAPSGKEIWFTATAQGSNLAVRAVTLSGKTRNVLAGPGRLVLHDIAPDGRLLLHREAARRAIMCRPRGERTERDLSWLDYSSLSALSRDGSLVLVGETGEGGGERYGAYVRKTDGSPAVRLGDGSPDSFSADEKSVLVLVPGPEQKLVLLPIGAGEPRTLPDYGLTVRGANWFPDGKRLLLTGARPGEPLRLFLQDIAGGPSRRIGPESVGGPPALSPDGRRIFVVGGDNKGYFYPSEGGSPREYAAYEPGQWPAGWSADSRFVYLFHPQQSPLRVWRVDADSGRRELWREIPLADPTGLDRYRVFVLSQDGEVYAYGYSLTLSDLYIVEGAR